MASNVNLPSSVIAQVAREIQTEEESYMDMICTKVTARGTLAGLFPVRSGLLLRGENRDLTPGAIAKATDTGGGQLPYNCLAQVGKTYAYDEVVSDWAAYGEDELAEDARIARADANLAVDIKGFNVLRSASNTTFNATGGGAGDGAWTDTVNSHPYKQLLHVRTSLAFGANMVVMGILAANALLTHTDSVSESSNFAAGQADYGSIQGIIARKLGIPVGNVIIVEKLYDTTAEGVAAIPTYLFGKEVWVGMKENLHMIDPAQARQNNVLSTEYHLERRAELIQWTRYVDIVRSGGTNRGVLLTNVVP